jgi:hypothetical protein
MFKKIKILLLLILISRISFGQIDTIADLRVLFSNIGDSLVFNFKYIEESETIYLTFYKDSILQRGLKMLIKDIHPEGIFILSEEERNRIRILSIDNGNKFIEENFRRGFRLSKSTNYVEFTVSSNASDVKLFIEKMKEYLRHKNSPLKENKKIDVYMPRTKN